MIRAQVKGVGHYLGSSQTLGLMETAYIYPNLADRTSPKEWMENGQPELMVKATARKDAILSAPSSAEFDPELDRAIRAKFNIHLK